MVVIISKGDMGALCGQKPRTIFTCKRIRVYRSSSNMRVKRKGKWIGKKKCEYPFTIKDVKLSIGCD